MENIDMIPVTSSNIRAIGWKGNILIDDGFIAKDVLRISYLSGALFDYVGVDERTFKAFLETESKGSFFHKSIKGKYQEISRK